MLLTLYARIISKLARLDSLKKIAKKVIHLKKELLDAEIYFVDESWEDYLYWWKTNQIM
jgi:hypothetical protein